MASIRDLLKQIQGFAGGNMQGQLDDDMLRAIGQNRGRALGGAALHDAGDAAGKAIPAPVVTSPSEMILPIHTRPRQVNTPPPASIRALMDARAAAPVSTTATPESEPTMRPMQDKPYPFVNEAPVPFGSSNEPFNATRPRRTQMRDFIADDAQYLRDVEAKPMGKLDKALSIIRGLNENQRGGRGALTGRDREIESATRALGRDMAVEKQSTATDAREASILAGQERIRQGDERLAQGDTRLANQIETLAARKARWATMGKDARRSDALKALNSGSANDPENLEAITKELELPATLKPKFIAGETTLEPDDDGELQIINKRTGEVTKTGIKTYETTKEAGRMVRQERQARAAMQRTEAIIAAGIGKLGDPAVTEASAKELEDKIEELEEQAAEKAEQGYPSQAAKILGTVADLRKTTTALKEAANKARTAQGATPKSSRTIEGAIGAFTKKNGRAPNAQEIANMKAALGK